MLMHFLTVNVVRQLVCAHAGRATVSDCRQVAALITVAWDGEQIGKRTRIANANLIVDTSPPYCAQARRGLESRDGRQRLPAAAVAAFFWRVLALTWTILSPLVGVYYLTHLHALKSQCSRGTRS